MSPRPLFRALVVAATLFGAPTIPATAADLLDYVIAAIDPSLAPARPLIECLAAGGEAAACAADAAKHQALGALPIGPSDNRVVKTVAIFEAARDERWRDVVTIGGEVVARSLACAMVPVQGPLKTPACNIIGWVLSKNVAIVDDAYRALSGPDWWALVELAGPGVCGLIPGNGAAGIAKEVLCGPLASVLLEAKKMAETLVKGLEAGADALENAIFGDDSHMPYDTYYAIYWQPWYHYSVARVMAGQGIGMGDIYDNCVDYFDSHNQYRSTARKTCRDLRTKYTRHVEAFAAAFPVAVDGYFQTVAKPAVRGFAVASYGKPAAADVPGRKFFEQNCAFQMRLRFPFPEPDDAKCRLLEQRVAVLKKKPDPFSFAVLNGLLAKQCYANVKLQDVQPTVWARACEEAGVSYGQVFAGESLSLIAKVGRLTKLGCERPPSGGQKTGGLVLGCGSPQAYAACLAEFPGVAAKVCRRDIAAVSARGTPGASGPVGPAIAAAVPFGGSSSAGSPSQRARSGMSSPVMAAPGDVRRLQSVEVEAESLLVPPRYQLRGGEAVPQPMTGFGSGWGGGAQLFWRGGAVGAVLDLLVDVPTAGRWSVELWLTSAPDYGRLAFEVDGTKALLGFDGYTPSVSGPATVSLGTFTLQPGPRRVSLMITGKAPASSGWLAGVDRVRLRLMEPS